jgi:hypothetical protein
VKGGGAEEQNTFQNATVVYSVMIGILFYYSKIRKKVVGLERGPLSLVTTTEELLDRKVTAPV